MTQKRILISEIEHNLSRQPRVKVLTDYVIELRDLIREGANIRPIEVFSASGKDAPFFLSDGEHRIQANVACGFKEIDAEILIGDVDAAFEKSLGSNDAHGQRRTNADKHRAVMLALEHPKYLTYGDRAIAAICKVSDKTVGAIREQLRKSAPEKKDATSGNDAEPEKRTGLDGKAHPAKKTDGDSKPKKKPEAKKKSEPEISEKVQRLISDGKEWQHYASVLHSLLTKKSNAYGHCPAYLITALARLHKSLELVLCPECKGKKCDSCAKFGVVMKHPFPAKP